MPRYFFHLYNDLDVADQEGQEHPNLDAARTEAQNEAREMMGELLKEDGRVVLHHRIDIEDEAGAVLSTVWFNDVVSIEQLDRGVA